MVLRELYKRRYGGKTLVSGLAVNVSAIGTDDDGKIRVVIGEDGRYTLTGTVSEMEDVANSILEEARKMRGE